jgi:hypothetical protein
MDLALLQKLFYVPIASSVALSCFPSATTALLDAYLVYRVDRYNMSNLIYDLLGMLEIPLSNWFQMEVHLIEPANIKKLFVRRDEFPLCDHMDSSPRMKIVEIKCCVLNLFLSHSSLTLGGTMAMKRSLLGLGTHERTRIDG